MASTQSLADISWLDELESNRACCLKDRPRCRYIINTKLAKRQQILPRLRIALIMNIANTTLIALNIIYLVIGGVHSEVQFAKFALAQPEEAKQEVAFTSYDLDHHHPRHQHLNNNFFNANNKNYNILEALPLISSSSSSSSGERPKLIQLVAAESGYNENSSVNILCTVSSGHHDTLTFDWFKDGQPIHGQLDSSSSSSTSTNNNLLQDNLNPMIYPQHQQQQQQIISRSIQVDKHQDHSLLRISQVQASHAGRYTCSAKNQFGQDSSSVTLRVNVKLHWTREPPRDMIVSANQELKLDCLAHGEPKPLIRWERIQQADSFGSGGLGQAAGNVKLTGSKISGGSGASNAAGSGYAGYSNSPNVGTQTIFNGYKLANNNKDSGSGGTSVLVSSNRYLTISRARESDAGLYECIASNGNDPDLRKLVHVQIRGEYDDQITPRFAFDQRRQQQQQSISDNNKMHPNIDASNRSHLCYPLLYTSFKELHWIKSVIKQQQQDRRTRQGIHQTGTQYQEQQ